MKRKFFTLSLTLLLGLFMWTVSAATGWYQDYIKLNVNGAGVTAPTGWFWIGSDPSYATQFDAANLGNVASLKLDGADMKYWGDGADRTGGSFFYEVKSADGVTTYIAATEVIWTQTALGGNDFQGTSSGLNVDLLSAIPAGTACKLTVWAKSWGSGGDSWLNNGGSNYVATFTKASVAIFGANGITDGTSYTTLKGAFDAINANASGLSTDNIQVRVSDNTTETSTAALYPSKGVSAISTTAGSGYVAPVITLTGGTTSAAGSLTVVITNGSVTSITMTGGTWTAAPTVSIAAPAGGGTTATASAAGNSVNQTFTITNGGSGYGPTATFSGGEGTGARIDVIITVTVALSGASSPRTATFAATTLTYGTLSCGSGYTSLPNCSISAFPGATTGTVTATALYPSIEYNSLVVYPTVAGKTISGAVGLISILGRRNVTIDGRVNRTGTPSVGNVDNLTIASTDATNAVIELNSNAQNDTIQYCTIKGNVTANTKGIVLLGSATSISNGNGNNTIDRNLISNNGSAVLYGLYSIGSIAFPNVGNQITKNEFKDILNTTLATNVLFVAGGGISPQNDNFTISGNSFYNVGLNASSGGTRQMIAIGGSGPASYGGSHTIINNYLGSTAANCSGTNIIKYNQSSNFNGIYISTSPSTVGGGSTSIQNNTIQKISWQNGGNANFFAISVAGTGNANIGTVTGNTIGDNSTTGSIVTSNFSTTVGNTTGIQINTTGTVDCQNNKIGSFTVWNGNATTATAAPFNGIQKTATAGTTTISNNIIGSTTTANSIYAYRYISSTIQVNPVAQNVYPILFQGTGTGTISNNTIANVTNFTTTGNLVGITLNGAGSTTTVNGNLVAKNRITGYTGTGVLSGIRSQVGTNTITNNIVSLGDNNPNQIRAIWDDIGANIFHNTIYVGGNPASGSFESSSLYCGNTNTRDYRNNIVVNERSNTSPADGKHYAIQIISTTGTLTCNGNNYFVSGTGSVLGRFGGTAGSGDKTSLPIVTSQDAASVNLNPSFTNASGSTAESFVPSSLLLTGVDLSATVGADYNTVSRTTTPTMGAHDYRVYNGGWNTSPTADFNARIDDLYSGGGFASRNVVVGAGKKLEITSGNLAVGNNLTLLSDASNGTGTYTNAGSLTLGGTSTVQQYVTAGRNWYVSSPVSATGYGVLNRGTSVVEWNEATKVWDTKSTGTLTPGRGYIQVATSNPSVTGTTGTVDFSGTLNHGDVAVTLSRTESGLSRGFNLVGNPYPSYLDWSDVIADGGNNGIGSSFWYRTKNDAQAYIFYTHNGTTGYTIPANQTPNTTTINGKIPPAQAFWVRVNQNVNTEDPIYPNNSVSLTFKNNMREHGIGDGNLLKAPKNDERKRIRLQLSNGTSSDETLVFFDAQAANGFDQYDSPKMLNSSSVMPDIYSKSGDEKLAMNGLAETTNELELPLGFSLNTPATLTLKATEMANFGSANKIYLIDKESNTQTELQADTEYNFSTTESTTNNETRFSLLFRAPGAATAVDNTGKSLFNVFVNAADQLVINAPAKSSYVIYNATGQQIQSGILNTEVQTVNSRLQTGVYVVKVNNQSTRVIVK